MRWLLGIILTIGLAVFAGYVFIKGYPYRLYSNWIQGKEWNRFYSHMGYTPMWLAPVPVRAVPPYKEDYAQLWKEFPLRNAMMPLPVRHPLFQTVPVVESVDKKTKPRLGMGLLNPTGRELSRIYTLPMMVAKDHSQGQELFKLPFVKNRILKLSQEKLWNDVFSFTIEVKSKTLEEMIYDLYILHLRSKILPKETVRYGLIKEGQAIIELESQDKDYIVELVLNYNSGSIYSYVLRTEKNSDESQKLRSKFLTNISFVPIDPAMGKFLYKEFKQLNFSRQVDQEGMLYLFSAWTHELNNLELLKEMIFFLERGRNNSKQLRPLYSFAMNHYGKTFTSKKIFNVHDDPNLILQRKIEIETIERLEAASKNKPEPEADLTPDEKMNLYLKKAKEEPGEESKDMVIH